MSPAETSIPFRSHPMTSMCSSAYWMENWKLDTSQATATKRTYLHELS
ncbi:hypothetical protein FHX09_002772 [Rhizobium sp. BK538]|nr:hypothetical protein [Rhizobium sp. BK538]